MTSVSAAQHEGARRAPVPDAAPDPGPVEELRADVALVGVGAAGGSLLRALVRDGRAVAGRRPLRVVALEAPAGGDRRSPVRSWCTWGPPRWRYAGDVAAAWGRVRLVDPRGGEVAARLDPWEYRLVRSGDFEARVEAVAAGAEGVELRRAVVTAVEDGPAGAVVRARDGAGGDLLVRARWVLDSRLPALPRSAPPGRTLLLQHFRGWWLRTPEAVFDPAAVTLMDFRVPQPARGVAFGYVLPTSAHEALVEYTEFSRAPLSGPEYEHALGTYLRDVLGVRRSTVVEVEAGAIPMTDVPLGPRAGASVFPLGTAAGAVRPSTGYAFGAVQRQVDGVVAALARGLPPRAPVPHRQRHLLMDAALLRALDSGAVCGAELFVELFRRNPVHRVLGFLDGSSTLAQDLAVMASAPRGPMLRTVAGLVGARAGAAVRS